ncbi:unnamed protein product, partial [Rotaria sp. Silwood1]
AFVASTSPILTKFYLLVIYQRTTQELMDGLAVSMKDALKDCRYCKKTRDNARLFQQEGRNIKNPQPGTVIDHIVTSAEWYDFYLI